MRGCLFKAIIRKSSLGPPIRPSLWLCLKAAPSAAVPGRLVSPAPATDQASHRKPNPSSLESLTTENRRLVAGVAQHRLLPDNQHTDWCLRSRVYTSETGRTSREIAPTISDIGRSQSFPVCSCAGRVETSPTIGTCLECRAFPMHRNYFSLNGASGQILIRDLMASIERWNTERISAKDRACLAKISGRLPHTERLAAHFSNGWNRVLKRDRSVLLEHMLTLADDFILDHGSKPEHGPMNDFLWGEARNGDSLSKTIARDFLALNEDIYWITQLAGKLSDPNRKRDVQKLLVRIRERIGIAGIAHEIPPPFKARWSVGTGDNSPR